MTFLRAHKPLLSAPRSSSRPPGAALCLAPGSSLPSLSPSSVAPCFLRPPLVSSPPRPSSLLPFLRSSSPQDRFRSFRLFHAPGLRNSFLVFPFLAVLSLPFLFPSLFLLKSIFSVHTPHSPLIPPASELWVRWPKLVDTRGAVRMRGRVGEGVCVSVSVSVCPSPPSPPPSPFPKSPGSERPLIHFLASPSRVANRLGALRARPPTPQRRRAGRGGSGAPARRVPSAPSGPRRRAREARGPGLALGQLTPLALASRCPLPLPQRAWDLGQDQTGPGPGQALGLLLCPARFQLAPLDSRPPLVA